MPTYRYLLFLTTALHLQTFSQNTASAFLSNMVFVKADSFRMGSINGKANEKPVHTVQLNDFYIGRFEVTQEEWLAIMGEDSKQQTDCKKCAVYDISFKEIELFLKKLQQQTNKHFRLPTEAEWEYAATGGKESKSYLYAGSNTLDTVAWYAPNAGGKTHPVGLKQPNELGLYDMSGNVWELCVDWYNPFFYKRSPKSNPENLRKSKYRVTRGGSWRSEEQRCQVHARNRDSHDHHISNSGIRLVMEPDEH